MNNDPSAEFLATALDKAFPGFDIGAEFGRVKASQDIALNLGRALAFQEVAAVMSAPGTELEKLHRIAALCEREAK